MEKRGVWMVLFKGLFSSVTLFSLSLLLLLVSVGSAGAKRIQEMHHAITQDAGNPYAAGPKDPIKWGGLPQVL